MSFEADIRPLFCPEDLKAMSFAFDLSAYEEVRENAEEIHARVADGMMPCAAPCPGEDVERFRAWIDGGMSE